VRPRDLLTSERLAVRLTCLWLVGVGANLGAWWIGHAFLPQGALSGVFPVAEMASREIVAVPPTARILLYNLVVAGGLIAVSNLFRVAWFPLGYLPVLFHWTAFGLFLGTNSFAVDRIRPTHPSAVRLVTSPGFAELTAYTVLGAATVGLWLFRQESWTRWATRRERSWREIRLKPGELAAIAVSAGLLVYGAVREADKILAVTG